MRRKAIPKCFPRRIIPLSLSLLRGAIAYRIGFLLAINGLESDYNLHGCLLLRTHTLSSIEASVNTIMQMLDEIAFRSARLCLLGTLRKDRGGHPRQTHLREFFPNQSHARWDFRNLLLSVSQLEA